MADDEAKREIISRKEAKRTGVVFYFTGRQCRRGHLCERYVSTHQCVQCVKAFSKKWYGEDRHLHREKINAKKRRSLKRRREEISEKKRVAYAQNRQKLNVIQRSKYAENPEKRRVHNRNWQSRRGTNGGTHSIDDIFSIWEEQDRKCAFYVACRQKVTPKSWHVDHIRPLSRGGRNDRKNLQITCARCNLRKHARDPLDHARSLGMLL